MSPSPPPRRTKPWIFRTGIPRSLAPVAGFTLGFGLIGVAWSYWTRPVSATVRLLAYERTFSSPTEAADFVATVKATNALAKLAAKLPRRLATENWADRCSVTVDPSSAYIAVAAEAGDRSSARDLAQAFAAQVAEGAGEWVTKRTQEADRQIADAQRRLKELRKGFADFNEALLGSDVATLRTALARELADKSSAASALQNQLAALNAEEKKTITALAADQPALRALQQDLEQALARYTDEHPKVKELRASIIALQKENVPRPAPSGSTRTNAQLADLNSQRGALRDQLKKAEAGVLKSRATLQKFSTNEVEFSRLQSEYAALGARRDELIQARVLVGNRGVEKWRRADSVAFTRVTDPSRLGQGALSGSLLGLGVGAVSLGLAGRRRRVIRNGAMLEEATGLPLLATLPGLEQMSGPDREYWAVRTLEGLRKTANTDRRGSFVVGFISCGPGEGRSTWIDLLAQAGLKSGNRVLVVSRPGGPQSDPMAQLEKAGDDADGAAFVQPARMFRPETSDSGSQAIARYSLARNVTEVQFYKQWERSFSTWQEEENALILVELPPASTAEALLLAASVPNVVWLSAANLAPTRVTTDCVETLKNTGCKLIGAALNMCSSPTRNWAALAALLVALTGLAGVQAQETTPAAAPAPAGALSATKAPPLAPWQEKLTLGPGDVFDISLYGQADSSRPGMIIAPDGRISYLQAVDVVASGLTVDELRMKLENILAKYHLAPRVVIVPGGFHSKKYIVLGNVVQKGVFPLDRPVTVVEAVARAKGFVSLAQQRSSFRMVDLSHAFLVRRQTSGEYVREPVDFEALFLRGDLQNNKLLAPDDYLYFPPLDLEEVYLLGEVRGPGVVPYTKELTVLGAIAGRGGITDAAFKQRILVIRGSLQKPETFIINYASILRAETPDFKLEPRDIVFVSRKPWAKAEELLEAAASDFARAAVTTWVGRKMDPLFNINPSTGQ